MQARKIETCRNLQQRRTDNGILIHYAKRNCSTNKQQTGENFGKHQELLKIGFVQLRPQNRTKNSEFRF